MRKRIGLSLLILLFLGLNVFLTQKVIALETEEGFVSLFNGENLDGWVKRGGDATYRVADGEIIGECQPGPFNTFLCSEQEFGDFILKLDFKVAVPGNSGVQFRSHARPDVENRERVFGYQAEIDPSDVNDTGRIYDEGRRGHQYGIIWLDRTPDDKLVEARAAYKPGEWNEMEIQCVGPSIRTWINGVQVVNFFDYLDLSGFLALQVHAGNQGTIHWKNIRIKDLGVSEWHPFFVDGKDGKQLVAAYKFVPECWKFNDEEGYLIGYHTKTEVRDGLIVSDGQYDNFAARVTYQINGGNSALYFRAEEVNTSWLLRGYQNEIAGNEAEAGIWHTAGDQQPGRGWLGKNEELVKKLRNENDWNTICSIAYKDRIMTFLNGFNIVDINDPEGEKIGKLGLQLHGGADVEMKFKDFEVLPITPQMQRLIDRE
ncbi:MAG: DUF1080 domain-containing protein [Planctomycetia bacterium]|nr:DUF1080 domain-containing protein [Planctomycetia bacterium]